MDNTEWGNPEIPGENPYAAHANPAQSTDRASADPLAPRSEPRGLLRRLLARGFQIFLLSMVLFIPVAYLIWRFVEPTYEAFSLLQVEPAQPKLYSDRGQDNVDFKSVVPYLQTQIKLITSDRVLEPVVTNSSVAKLPVITKSEDPKADLRKKLDVEIQEDSYLIRASVLELPNGDHAAKIVNAVVDSYLSYNKDYKHGANAQLKASLQLQLEKLKNELKTRSGDLQALHQKGTVETDKPQLNLGRKENGGDGTQPTFSSLPAEQIQTIVDQMVKSDLELIATRAALDARRAANRQSPETINELKIKLDELTRKREALVKLFEQLKIEKEVNTDTFQFTLLNYELQSLLDKREKVTVTLAQLDFESEQDNFRVVQVHQASEPKIADNDNLLKAMSAAPIGIFFLVAGLFLVREIIAGPAPRQAQS